MTKEQAIKIYNKLEVGLWELNNFFRNTGTIEAHENEVQEFLSAGHKLQRLIEKKFYDNGKAV